MDLWTPTHRVTLDGGHVATLMLCVDGEARTQRDFGFRLSSGYRVNDAGYWTLYGMQFSGEIVDLATGQPVAGACEPLLDPDGDYPDDETVDVYPAPMATCPMCEGPGQELGRLGRFPWYRCRNCGWDWCVEVT